jgi:hypothetical protein
MRPSGHAVDNLQGNRSGASMKSSARIEGGLNAYVDANWPREGGLKDPSLRCG